MEQQHTTHIACYGVGNPHHLDRIPAANESAHQVHRILRDAICGEEKDNKKVSSTLALDRKSQQIKNSIRSILKTDVKPGDDVIVYYSGHANQEGKLTGEETTSKFAPKEVVDLREVVDWCRSSVAGNVFLLLDACHSGTSVEFSQLQTRISSELIKKKNLVIVSSSLGEDKSFSPDGSELTTFANRLTEIAYEGEEKTFNLFEGLKDIMGVELKDDIHGISQYTATHSSIVNPLKLPKLKRPSVSYRGLQQGKFNTMNKNKEKKEVYKFLDAFSVDEQEFYHRDESYLKRSLQLLENQPTLVIHGESGVGKSSYVHAGILPRLREEVLIEEGKENRERYNCYLSLSLYSKNSLQEIKKALNKNSTPKDSLKELLERKSYKKQNWVFVFDQFDDFFENLNEAQQQEFISEVADCMNSVDKKDLHRFIFAVKDTGKMLTLFERLEKEQNAKHISAKTEFQKINSLTHEEAHQAINKMGKYRDNITFSFKEGVIEHIISDLSPSNSNQGVYPPYLQIALKTLFEKITAEDPPIKGKDCRYPVIINDLVGHQDKKDGDQNQKDGQQESHGIIHQFLLATLSSISEKLSIELEQLQVLLGEMVQSDGSSNPVGKTFSEMAAVCKTIKGKRSFIDEEKLQQVLKSFVDNRILHFYSDNNVIRYGIAHESLGKIIVQWIEEQQLQLKKAKDDLIHSKNINRSMDHKLYSAHKAELKKFAKDDPKAQKILSQTGRDIIKMQSAILLVFLLVVGGISAYIQEINERIAIQKEKREEAEQAAFRERRLRNSALTALSHNLFEQGDFNVALALAIEACKNPSGEIPEFDESSILNNRTISELNNMAAVLYPSKRVSNERYYSNHSEFGSSRHTEWSLLPSSDRSVNFYSNRIMIVDNHSGEILAERRTHSHQEKILEYFYNDGRVLAIINDKQTHSFFIYDVLAEEKILEIPVAEEIRIDDAFTSKSASSQIVLQKTNPEENSSMLEIYEFTNNQLVLLKTLETTSAKNDVIFHGSSTAFVTLSQEGRTAFYYRSINDPAPVNLYEYFVMQGTTIENISSVTFTDSDQDLLVQINQKNDQDEYMKRAFIIDLSRPLGDFFSSIDLIFEIPGEYSIKKLLINPYNRSIFAIQNSAGVLEIWSTNDTTKPVQSYPGFYHSADFYFHPNNQNIIIFHYTGSSLFGGSDDSEIESLNWNYREDSVEGFFANIHGYVDHIAFDDDSLVTFHMSSAYRRDLHEIQHEVPLGNLDWEMNRPRDIFGKIVKAVFPHEIHENKWIRINDIDVTRIFSLETGDEIMKFPFDKEEHTAFVYGTTFSPNGQHFLQISSFCPEIYELEASESINAKPLMNLPNDVIRGDFVSNDQIIFLKRDLSGFILYSVTEDAQTPLPDKLHMTSNEDYCRLACSKNNYYCYISEDKLVIKNTSDFDESTQISLPSSIIASEAILNMSADGKKIVLRWAVDKIAIWNQESEVWIFLPDIIYNEDNHIGRIGFSSEANYFYISYFNGDVVILQLDENSASVCNFFNPSTSVHSEFSHFISIDEQRNQLSFVDREYQLVTRPFFRSADELFEAIDSRRRLQLRHEDQELFDYFASISPNSESEENQIEDENDGKVLLKTSD